MNPTLWRILEDMAAFYAVLILVVFFGEFNKLWYEARDLRRKVWKLESQLRARDEISSDASLKNPPEGIDNTRVK